MSKTGVGGISEDPFDCRGGAANRNGSELGE